jgi:hypothetical protein
LRDEEARRCVHNFPFPFQLNINAYKVSIENVY